MRDLPDFDQLLPDPASRRFADNDDALEAVLDAMTLVELADWVRDHRLVRECFEVDFADEIADYLADV